MSEESGAVTSAEVPDESPAATDAPAARATTPPSPSDVAIERYRARMRRGRTVYYAALAVIVAAVGTLVGVVLANGEAAHASLHTFAPPPAALPLESAAQTQQEVWHSSDHLAAGTPLWGGTLVTYSAHTIGGLDARTGKRTWSYTRTDRTICAGAQLTGTAVAIFDNNGNCDEVDAFDADTGLRRWTRTLDMDGQPVNGSVTLQVTDSAILVASRTTIYAIDPVSGFNKWVYSRYGCTVDHVVLGSAGALISQNCSVNVRCKDVKFCGVGPQLLLRDGNAGRNDKDKPNADEIKWNLIGNAEVPVSADQVISSVTANGQRLRLRASDHGTRIRSVTLTPVTSSLGPITAYATDQAEIIWLAGQTYAIRPDAAKPQWRTDTPGPPVVSAPTVGGALTLATARITVPTNTGIGIVDGNDGQIIQSFSVQTPPAGARVYSLGRGFLVAGPSGMVAYR
ncbi:MAG TPA: PQQ-binding-like beta-propeller repeat protein [Jatrophihabitans sp.]|nr:PQQ-binding-like beta-propeller repeat protein [Jatrophihabitans sp.]